ncbi:MAG: sigma-54-dependent Fis family transcriptional regulator [Gammaproteobacteria bacterium]|nr:sigma-54-dependent Fis family transcriptional regulator [Gammaproteobacteria bacterium]
MKPQVLIVEDEPLIRGQIAKRLQRDGCRVTEADSVEQAQALDPSAFDLVMADLRLPGAPGVELVKAAAGAPVLIMTSYASISSAVECIRQGAADYIAKPFEFDELLLIVRRLIEQARLLRSHRALTQDVARNWPVEGLVGTSPPMREVAERIRKVAATDATVLICGESGTGKELVARAIHAASGRSGGPFVAVNCAAIPDNLIEAELFGYERGAFTGAAQRKAGLFDAAHHGTLFLDEIGELALAAQARLLRALQDGEIRAVGAVQPRHVSVRVLAATHRDLAAMVAQRTFREDLFFRLRVMEIRLPPLRERDADIDLLIDHLLVQIAARLGRNRLQVTAGARRRLREYPWPGNVRELANCLERAAILCDGDTLESPHLGLQTAAASSDALSLDDYFRDFVLRHQRHLTESELARRLGISRKSLWERRQRMGIPRQRGEP